MASHHVWQCDECGREVRTHNDYECLKLPAGWSAKVSQQGLSCEDCTAQIKLVNSAFSEPSDIRHITHEDEARYWLSDEAMEND